MNLTISLRLSRARIVAALVAALVVVGSAAAIAQTAVVGGKGVSQVKVSRFLLSEIRGDTPQDLPGVAALKISVPAGQVALVRLTFAAESQCGPGDLNAQCRMALQFRRSDSSSRIQIKNILWQSNEAGAVVTGAAHAMTATVGPLSPGNYVLHVQGQIGRGTSKLLLQNGEFVAELIAA